MKPTMNAAIRFPMIYELINTAQKYPKKKPLFSAVAQSATYFPYATQRIPAPNPFTAAEKSTIK